MTLKVSVGMAVFDQEDFWESLRAEMVCMYLSIVHADRVGEIIICDNNPLPGNPLRDLPDKTGLVRYIEMPSPVGTSAPRNRVFEEAKFDHVVCIDPHVFLYPGTFDAVADFYDTHGHDCPDILHAWLYTERFGHLYGTHMNDQWREQMLGTWGWAWEVPAERLEGFVRQGGPARFSVIDLGDHLCHYMTLDGQEQRELDPKEQARYGLPQNLTIYGHERLFQSLGYTQPSEPFEVPGHGMWFWACRKDAWLPFHEKCRGFGGEEITTGKRFRKAGRQVWSLPGAGGWHHFGRRGGRVPYRLTAYDKVRNYCLEFQRLGLDLEPIRRHFNPHPPEWIAAVRGEEWPSFGLPSGAPASAEASHQQQLAEGGAPARRANQPRSEEVKPRTSGPGAAQAVYGGIEGLHRAAVAARSSINMDLPHLKHLAATCGEGDKPGDCVVEIAHQSVSFISLAAGGPKRVVSYGGKPPGRTALVQVNAPGVAVEEHAGVPATVPDCDLLFLDASPHTATHYYSLLTRLQSRCRHYVAVHDSVAYGTSWNSEPGLMEGVTRFLAEHPEWHAVAHHTTQSGLLVLSRDAGDKDKATAPPEAFADVQPINSGVREQIPDEGVGTELKAILASVGIEPNGGCDCNARMQQMNAAGVDWCRQNKHTLVGWLKDGAERWGWAAALAEMAKHPIALAKIAMKVKWSDPYPGLVDEAIRQFESKQIKGAS